RRARPRPDDPRALARLARSSVGNDRSEWIRSDSVSRPLPELRAGRTGRACRSPRGRARLRARRHAAMEIQLRLSDGQATNDLLDFFQRREMSVRRLGEDGLAVELPEELQER